MRHALLLTLGLAIGATLTQSARAHESRPLYIEVTETAPLSFLVRWKIPPSVKVSNAPEVSMIEGCAATTPNAPAGGGRGNLRHRTFRCDADPAGTALRIHYPLFNPSVSALVRISRLSGETYSLLASPDESEVIIPALQSFGSVARDYLMLGVRHILGGYDHLLFLVCLLLIAGTGRRILITITGFTIAHSITLALSALGVVRVPIAPVEAAIALSIVFLAIEIVRGDPNSLTYRYPVAVSSSFGLLHGLGFAAVLGETGLPQTEIPAALLFFNVGVEIGQILFVAAVIAVYQLIRFVGRTSLGRDLSISALRPLQTPAAYAVGMLASFWMVQRVATFWTT
ncbi:MAG: HupE/UreJ family protein [Deltaproteobacteria bacterium]|nr:HupE/UreJ family protein [Deltaproteobacteria bacterium]